LKGSGSINQISFNTILLSRDKMAEDEYARNSTQVQVVKCRRTGLTGSAGWLYYNGLTGRLERGEKPEIREANNIEEF
jgi:twinkle protein